MFQAKVSVFEKAVILDHPIFISVEALKLRQGQLSGSVKRIAYVDSDQPAESLSLTSPSPCFYRDVHHCRDGVHCGPTFSKAELVLRQILLAHHVILKSLQNQFLLQFSTCSLFPRE